MSDYLMRAGAPISEETWSKIDDMVVTVAQKALVGRKFLEIAGPMGWGVQVAPRFGFGTEDGAFTAQSADYIRLTELASEFKLKAQHLAIADQTSHGLDLGAVAMAAVALTRHEDELIVGGLMKAAEHESALGDWAAMGQPFGAVSRAIATLRQAGIEEPFALVLNPKLYAELASLMQHGRREMAMVESVVKAGVFQYPDMPADKALLVGSSAWNADIVLGQDIATAYLGNEGLDHRFRIFETLALRIKRPASICVLA